MSIRPNASELVELIRLEDIRFFEVTGKIDTEPASDETAEVDDEENFDVAMAIGERADDHGVVAFCTVSWKRAAAAASVRVGGLYTQREDVTEDIEYDDDVLLEFAHRVARFQMIPFAREGLITTASRLRIEPPPLLPLLLNSDGPGALNQPSEPTTKPSIPSAKGSLPPDGPYQAESAR